MCVDVRKIDWSAVIELNNVNAAVDYFNTMVTDVFDKHAPRIRKIVKGRPCKWLNRELKKEMHNRDRQLRKARKTNSGNDWTRYKSLRNHCNSIIRKAKSNYHKNLLSENEANPCKFWNAIKEIYPTKPKLISLSKSSDLSV